VVICDICGKRFFLPLIAQMTTDVFSSFPTLPVKKTGEMVYR